MFLTKCGLFCLMVFVHGQRKESMDCKENSDCMMDRGYCHPSSKMCLCKNEASTYPACTIQEGDVCDPQCKEKEFCDLKTKKCMCSLGGFTLNCNTMVCPEFQVQRGIKCSCMYGEENGKCSKCKDECGSNEECRNQGGKKYKCVSKDRRKIRRKSPNSKQKTPKKQEKPSERKTCQKVESWGNWSSWTACSQPCKKDSAKFRSRECKTQGCCGGEGTDQETACRPEDCGLDVKNFGFFPLNLKKQQKPLERKKCQKVESWGDWTSWTACSQPCKEDSAKFRSRECKTQGCCGAGGTDQKTACRPEDCGSNVNKFGVFPFNLKLTLG
ncbi:A disintegrin and metalloproteinase with thrombospondin motifs adt-1 isoform X2 [Eurytemora carolleeae]|uniref:A disintegrin and metalloproteinase with thrombospondin motifs adt-1 isoform X2 n=1 Tax=Eurytemora carolleeae TaxID=1294199 RepID=UPI000C78F99A|nr:A disintegrin and metalloproteinase with thrombospondin motifs adt-1 isoform X2 [Eurytemora carolleeae]|eukprot:XP_023326491.1 A disintegrin and metalloproteinase with thrombospondin motifs adt-1-like isoform X2 [Eurytemora affinis]